jgi:cardiolipin synthase
LHDVVHHDWKHSHELDLTDAGLLADLEKHGGKGIKELGLDTEP